MAILLERFQAQNVCLVYPISLKVFSVNGGDQKVVCNLQIVPRRSSCHHSGLETAIVPIDEHFAVWAKQFETKHKNIQTS